RAFKKARVLDGLPFRSFITHICKADGVVILPKDMMEKTKRPLNKSSLKLSKAQVEYIVVKEERKNEIEDPHAKIGFRAPPIVHSHASTPSTPPFEF
ncbi:unnamed protein product, partial [Ilex paraguariensis]